MKIGKKAGKSTELGNRMSCICGHDPEDHKGEVGACEVEECICCRYEEEDEEDTPIQPIKERKMSKWQSYVHTSRNVRNVNQ